MAIDRGFFKFYEQGLCDLQFPHVQISVDDLGFVEKLPRRQSLSVELFVVRYNGAVLSVGGLACFQRVCCVADVGLEGLTLLARAAVSVHNVTLSVAAVRVVLDEHVLQFFVFVVDV